MNYIHNSDSFQEILRTPIFRFPSSYLSFREKVRAQTAVLAVE